jgi:small subunit ribosomal protein S9
MTAKTDVQTTGRRKTSVARVRIFPGTGRITVNNRDFDVYFPRETIRMVATRPLAITETLGKYDVVANVRGGGLTGQAGALSMGLARALREIAPESKETLGKDGLLTRDPRMKERKKYGQPGARKRFQFSKR